MIILSLVQTLLNFGKIFNLLQFQISTLADLEGRIYVCDFCPNWMHHSLPATSAFLHPSMVLHPNGRLC